MIVPDQNSLILERSNITSPIKCPTFVTASSEFIVAITPLHVVICAHFYARYDHVSLIYGTEIVQENSKKNSDVNL